MNTLTRPARLALVSIAVLYGALLVDTLAQIVLR